ncbi:hypothetical protein BC940DRAFT_309715 [Gongronella butleri]|nr:hypothetical protein BC940DRAFT_309715 [Gongronella butleri]
MSHRLLLQRPPQQLVAFTARNSSRARFGTSSYQWFQRFLNAKEEQQLYKSLTQVFRDRLNDKTSHSEQSYSNIIDHVIFGTQHTPSPWSSLQDTLSPPHENTKLTLAKLEAFTRDIDDAGRTNDTTKLDALWVEIQQAGQQVPTTMYNRLLRAYLQDKDLERGILRAESVIKTMLDNQKRLPTTRTCTYMMQAYLRRQKMGDARRYATMMQQFSLTKLRTSFDCGIMLQFLAQSGDAHAIDILWQGVLRHKDMIQPTPALYTTYVEWLVTQPTHALNKDTMRPHHHLPPSTFATRLVDTTRSLLELKKPQKSSVWIQHRVSIWLQVAQQLTNSDHCILAEQLLLHLEHVVDETTTQHPSATRQGTEAIQHLLYTYLLQAQDLKVVAFYVRLRQSGVKQDVFGTDLVKTISDIVDRVRRGSLSLDQQALMDEYGCVSQA